MSEFKVIESQEELDAIIKPRVERAIKKAKEEAKEEYESSLKSLSDENSNLKNEVGQYKKNLEGMKEKDEQITGLNKTIESYKREDLKRKIAVDCGLPFNLSNRIQGEDEESMRKDAESLSNFIKNSNPSVVPLKNVNEIKDDDSGLRSLLNSLDLEGE